ncbi:MAG: hypothetical protein JWM68_5102, partial [Verrucomicrobiales bacterium]|nr:hypothetical protein [Verrucomicrobiales bacterium]
TVVGPIEFRQVEITYNLQSTKGVPISTTNNNPLGSNGRMPLPAANESGSNLPGNTNQFRGFMGFGAIPSPTNRVALSNSTTLKNGVTAFSANVAKEMQLPMGKSNNVVVMILRRAQLGAPFVSRQVSYLFGSVIEVPSTDENGILLTNIVKEQYWLAEPHSTNNHTNATYYWSPNAEKVYAVQSGPVNVTWKKAASTTSVPPDYSTNAANYYVDGGNYFRLFKTSYVVSGSAVKKPRKIYWTEKTFQNIGKVVTVPAARVGAVKIVYNSGFTKTVPQEYFAPGQTSPTDGTTNAILAELRTLWFDQQTGDIHAYNQEGRVFVELLGDIAADGESRVQLGFEIVDVFKQVNPADIITELGERLVPPPPGSVVDLSPEPVLQSAGTTFAFNHTVAGSDISELFATRETRNLNDYMVHWMEAGEVGLRWPSQFARYKLVWPPDMTEYSQYVRPLVATEAEAKETAVPLSTENVPLIEYQDALDFPRAKLTEDFKFYTFLDTANPAHRTLLRFTSGENISFERVFSWLDVNLKSTNFAGSVATNLSTWNTNNNTLSIPDPNNGPRVVITNVDVGQRIVAPLGEIGGSAFSSNYFAGYIRQSLGKSFNPTAYVDPFVSGFPAANLGAIIPVNTIPGSNNLEVWWFRANGANGAKGFNTVYWPSVIGRYTIQWPINPPEIVLASNQGSAGNGISDPLEQLGTIYSQNNPNLPGYNPNEEHAIMSGGSAFALRDDLNNTNAVGYSSHPFVLVNYKTADGRPAMSAYKVLREKPSAGIFFDYLVKAGTLLQPPMPLGLMAQPVEGSGDSAVNYNSESSQAGGDLPVAWNDSRDAGGTFGHYKKFTYRDRKQGFWVYRGIHSGQPLLRAGSYVSATGTFTNLPAATAIVGQPFSYFIHASRESQYLTLITGTNLPSGVVVSGLSLQGTPTAIGSNTVQIIVHDDKDGSAVTNSLSLRVLASGSVVAQNVMHVLSTNSYTGVIIDFTNRPPFLAQSPVSSNSFTMRFYYKTEAGFDWPGVATPPAVGTVVPYLRPFDSTNNAFIGDGASKNTSSLDVVYRPIWPVMDPKDGTKLVATLPYGQTLTKAVNGLPGVHDFKTAHILYQQSIAANITNAVMSAVLHDPTREKACSLGSKSLTVIPSGIQKDYYQGKYYFPQLPPHLSSRLSYDPNRGANGSLVLKGEFKDELAGEKYVLLNVLRDADLAATKALCPTGDPNYTKWTQLVDALATSVETFYESPTVPGTYIPKTSVSVGVGDLAVVSNDNTAVDSYALSATGPGNGYITLIESSGTAFTKPGDPISMHIFKIGGSLYTGELKVIPAANPLSEQVTFQHTGDLAGRAGEYAYEWKIASPVDGLPPVTDATMSRYLSLTNGIGAFLYTLGGAGIQALSDNYVVMRYRPISTNHPLYKASPANSDWSAWTTPQLAEGWIKRVLAGINPYNQRTSDLFNNRVNTDASIVSQAGHRWEGDIALNIDTLDSHGLIEIYETVLRRGRSLSIESGFNYGPANDALLLASGYLNDLYMMMGNEAWADASNPTIGIGTKDQTYGDIATALFAFKGQEPSLLEEELALLRGRDDFLQPGVQTAPFYNRLVWNYTRGIDSGEVIYALNYNILDQDHNGSIDAADAARLFPQAHGDAYGHYLTAMQGYYSLLMNPNFDWAPRIEAVSVLGQPVSVDYLDERKFAAAAVAVARTGKQIFDLSWRKDYQPNQSAGWDYMRTTKVNSSRQFTTPTGTTNSIRYWGLDHWAARTGQGAYLNWVMGNAILPAVDPNPAHEGIQKVDRTTVPELTELPVEADNLQTAMENAENGMTPLGLSPGSVAFDVNPNQITAVDGGTHFEQIYQRAKVALKNAVTAFDDAKDVTRLMRSEQDSLADFQAGVDKQELSYTNSLIDLYGTPYADDIGVGKLYKQAYAGPDLFHFAYVDSAELTVTNLMAPDQATEFKIDTQTYSSAYEAGGKSRFDFVVSALNNNPEYKENVHYISYTLDSQGSFKKPATWTGKRSSPGKIQDAISRILLARNAALAVLSDNASLKRKLDRSVEYFNARVAADESLHENDVAAAGIQTAVQSALFAAKMAQSISDNFFSGLESTANAAVATIPQSTVVGLANGGDILSGARGAILASYAAAKGAAGFGAFAKDFAIGALKVTKESYLRIHDAEVVQPLLREIEDKREVLELDNTLSDLQSSVFPINQRLQELEAAVKNYQTLVAEGDRVQQERQVFRQRAAAVVQGFRTRDAAFRLFRNEKLERYKTLFDLSARYAYLSANAYDYETGLLNTDTGRSFVNRILNSRALGVVRAGEPQYAGSDTGDPGLSSVLAEMKADWDVVRGRLGFNNPDAYGTTASLRTENYRILPGTNGLANWQDLMRRTKKDNLLEDPDVRRYCMQIDTANGVAVPGFIFEFSTTIGNGFNVFGQQL